MGSISEGIFIKLGLAQGDEHRPLPCETKLPPLPRATAYRVWSSLRAIGASCAIGSSACGAGSNVTKSSLS